MCVFVYCYQGNQEIFILKVADFFLDCFQLYLTNFKHLTF